MVINQSSNQMITNWQGFNIGQTESVQFNQPGANSVALNRVIGQDPTAILGKLNANGQIFITNPSGVFFGPNSIINVGNLMATSLQISDQDFLNRNYRFTQDPSKSLASVINEGQINASGYIGLLGPRAENRGMLMANLGSIALGSGKAATMDFSGDGLINFAITEPVDGSFVDKDGKTVDNGAFNSGTIQADGGKVLLSAHTAQKMVRWVVNNTGVIRAQSVSKRNGAIYLEAGPNGTATNEGTLDASGTDSGETGGSVRILGHKVGQLGNAMVDVSGDQGGGEVLIGGDYQGKGSVQNAAVTFGGSNTVVKANAITDGNGGKVIYWADDTTRFYGAIEAKGGANSGDGGFVEVSGKQFLDFNGEVITTAANGQTGTLLLDPDDIIIKDALPDPGDTEISGDHVILFADGSGTFNISEAALEALNAFNDIVLQANNSITFQDLADNVFDLQTTSNNSVTFQTTNGAITFNDTNDLLRTQGGAINFIAGTTLTMGRLESNGGDINLTAGSNLIAQEEIRSGGGDISLVSGSSMPVGPMSSEGGVISLVGVGISVTGDIMTGGGAFLANAGTGFYTQRSNSIVTTAGGDALLIADNFEFLNDFTSSGGNIFGVPGSIVTDIFSFIDGPRSGTISIEPFSIGKSICIATTGCDIEISQNEIFSLRGSELNVGGIFTGDIDFGDVNLGQKKVNFMSGESITAFGDKIIFHDDISLTAGEDISITSGSNFEAHISGFNKTFTATADSDGLNGGSFTLSSDSSITTRSGDVSLTGNFVDVFGEINRNGGVLTTLELPTTFASIEEILDIFFSDDPFFDSISDPSFGLSEVSFGAVDFGVALIETFPDSSVGEVFSLFSDEEAVALVDQLEETFDIPSGPGDTNVDFFSEFPDDIIEEIIGKIEDKENAIQSTVLGDFLDNGSETSGC
jgi:filamentous hemagglutinin family protein